jgi:hypothetical protein
MDKNLSPAAPCAPPALALATSGPGLAIIGGVAIRP